MASNSVHLDFAIVDVFTQNKYEGNPLAIVRVPRTCTLSQEQKQNIAREFNLSETTFLHEQDPDAEPDSWTVDIFTTKEELPFAGHPTIGTACFVLSEHIQKRGVSDEVDAGFNLKAGPVELQYDANKNFARAAIPHDVHIHNRKWSREEVLKFQPKLAEAYRKGEIHVKEEFPIVSIVKGMTFVLIELDSPEALELVTTMGSAISMSGLDEGWNRTFVGSYFFVRLGESPEGATKVRTRMIEGTLEDPATGSAASDLAAYLSLLEGEPRRTFEYAITQGVEMGRRSDIHLQVVMTDDAKISKVVLGGSAIRVMEGRLRI